MAKQPYNPTKPGGSSAVPSSILEQAIAEAPKTDSSRRLELNPDDYTDYIRNIRPAQNLNLQRAKAQGFGEQLVRGIAQSVGEVVGGAIEGIGATLEAPHALYQAIAGEQLDFDNSIIEMGRGLREGIQDATPIYQENPGETFALTDTGWWLGNLPSLASAVSMMIPAGGAIKGAEWLSRLSGTSKVVSPVLKQAGRIALGATVSRNAENFRSSYEVAQASQQMTLEKLADPVERKRLMASDAARAARQQFGTTELTDEQFAQYIGAQAASRSYLVNSANVVMDALQFVPLLKKFKAMTRSGLATDLAVLKANGKVPTMTDKVLHYLNPAASAVGGSLGEGLEEEVNFVGDEEGKTYGKQLLGENTPDFTARAKQYTGDSHFWESAFWGVGGGVGFEAVGAFAYSDTGPQSKENKLAEIAGRKAMLVKAGAMLKAVQDDTNLTDAERVTRTARLKADVAFQLGISASKAGNVDLLLEQLQDKNFQQSLIQSGLTDEQDVAKAIEHTKADILSAERLYKQHAGNLVTSDISQGMAEALVQHRSNLDFATGQNQKRVTELDSLLNERIQSLPQAQQTGIDTTRHVALQSAIAAVSTQQAVAQRSGDTEAATHYQTMLSHLTRELTLQPAVDGHLPVESLLPLQLERELKVAEAESFKTRAAHLDTQSGKAETIAAITQEAKKQQAKSLAAFETEIAGETDAVTLENKLKDPTVLGHAKREAIVQKRLDAVKARNKSVRQAPGHQASVATSRMSIGEPPVVSDDHTDPQPYVDNSDPYDFAAMQAEPGPSPEYNLPDPVSQELDVPEPVGDYEELMSDGLQEPVEPVDTTEPVEQDYSHIPEPGPAPVGSVQATLTDEGAVAMNHPTQPTYNAPPAVQIDTLPVSVDNGQEDTPDPLPPTVRGVKVNLWDGKLKDAFKQVANLHDQTSFVLSDAHANLISTLQSLRPGDMVELRRETGGIDHTNYPITIYAKGVKIGSLSTLPELLREQRYKTALSDTSEQALRAILNDKQLAIMQMRAYWKENPSLLLQTEIGEVTGGSILNMPTHQQLDSSIVDILLDTETEKGGLWIGSGEKKLMKPGTTDSLIIDDKKVSTSTNVDAQYQVGQSYIFLDSFGGKHIPVPLSTPRLAELPDVLFQVDNQIQNIAGNLQHESMFVANNEGELKVSATFSSSLSELSDLVYVHDTEGVSATDSGVLINYRENGKTERAILYSRHRDGNIRLSEKGQLDMLLKLADGRQFHEGTPEFNKEMTTLVGKLRLKVNQKQVNQPDEFLLNERVYPSYNHFLAEVLKSNIGTAKSVDSKVVTHFSPMSQGIGKPGMDIALALPKNIPAPQRLEAVKPAQEPIKLQATGSVPVQAVPEAGLSTDSYRKFQEQHNTATPYRFTPEELHGIQTRIRQNRPTDRDTMVYRLRKEEIDNFKLVDNKNNVSSSQISLDAPVFLKKGGNQKRLKKADGQIIPSMLENIDKAEAWFTKTFPHIPFERVSGLINTGDEWAYGLFENAAVQLSDVAVQGTTYHEAFHVAFHLYQTDTQRQLLLAEKRGIGNTLTDEEVEEQLAEDFRRFMITREKPLGRIGQFFQHLWDVINAFLGKPKHTRELFHQIASKKFTMQPDARMLVYAKGLGSKLSVVPGLSHLEQRHVLDVLKAEVYDLLQDYVTPEYAQEIKDTRDYLGEKATDEEVLHYALHSVIRLYAKEEGMESHRDNYIRVLNAYNDSESGEGLWSKVKRELSKELGIDLTKLSLDELSQNQDALDALSGEDWDELEKSFDADPLQTNSENKLPGKLKHLIKTTAKLDEFKIPLFKEGADKKAYMSKDKSSFLGLNSFVDFKPFYTKLENALSDLTSEGELLERLEDLIASEPSAGDLYRRVYEDQSLLTAMYVHFNKQTPIINQLLLHKTLDGFSVDVVPVNNNKPGLKLGKEIKEQVFQFAAEGKFDPKSYLNARALRAYAYDTKNNKKIGDTWADVFKTIGINVNENGESLISLFVQTQLKNGNTKELDALESSLEYLKRALEKDKTDNEIGNMHRLGERLAKFQRAQMKNTTQNVEGKTIYPITLPNAISKFFARLKSKNANARQQVRQTLAVYLRDERFLHSWWMHKLIEWDGSYEDNQVAIQKEIEAALKQHPRHKEVTGRDWTGDRLEGIREGLRIRREVSQQIEDEFIPLPRKPRLAVDGLPILNEQFIDNFNYILDDGLKNSATGVGKLYSSQDAGDFDLSNILKYRSSQRGNNKTTYYSTMIPSDGGTLYSLSVPRIESKEKWEELHSAIAGEIAGMRAAKEHLFITNEDGSVTEKEGVIKQQYYHTDKDGKTTLRKGKPVGKAFQFQLFPGLNKVEALFDEQGFIKSDNTFSKEFFQEHIQPVIDEDIEQEAAKILVRLRAQPRIFEKEVSVDNQPEFARNFAISQKLFNHEYGLWLHGSSAEFKSGTDSNKRGKGPSAPGTSISKAGAGDSFRAITLKDVERPSARITQMEAGIRKSLEAAGLSGEKPEARLEAIIKPYREINATDAQGYMSLNRYEKVLRGMSRWNPRMKQLFRRVRAGESLPPAEQAEFLQPMKPYYDGRAYNSDTNMVSRNMIKYASVVLTPSLTKGTDLDELRRWMDQHNVDEAIYESAHKVGATGIFKLHNDDYSLDSEALYTSGKDFIRTYDNEHWQIQLDVPEHHIDASNKLGTQLAKLILANIQNEGNYTLNGNPITGKELIEQNFKTLDDYIQLETQNLLTELGATLDEEGNLKLSDLKPLEKLLRSELERRDTQDVLSDIATLRPDGKWTIPLSYSASADKFQSILLSLFTSRITNLRAPGLSAVLVSSAFMERKGATAVEYVKDFKGRADKKLRGVELSEDGKTVHPAEILLPHFMRSMMDGKSIDEIDPKLLEMLGYRIPTEKKSSMAPMRVVGFLPAELGSTMVVPDEFVVQMGSDFDVDKLFTMIRNGGVLSAKQKLQNELFEQYWSVLTSPHHFLEMVSPQGFDALKVVAQEIRQITGQSEELNPANYSSQAEFKKRNSVGVALKGLAADANSFGAVAQVARMEFSASSAAEVMYTSQEADLDELRSRYKDNVIESTDSYVIIRHTGLGWAPDGSFLNVNGEPILDVASQAVAAAVDGVKDPVLDAFNVGTITYHAWHTMILSGIPERTASLFTTQPIIKQLVKRIEEQRSILSDGQKKGFSRLIRELQQEYASALGRLGVAYNIRDLTQRQYNGGSVAKLLEANAGSYSYKAFSAHRLRQNLVDSNQTGLPKEKQISNLLDQLHALELFQKLKTTGDDLGDGIKVFKTDKLGAGPASDVTHSLQWLLENKVQSGSLKVRQGDELISAAEAVYPDFFDNSNKSVYPVLQSYLKNANQLSLKLMQTQFLHETPAGRTLTETIRQRISKAEGDYRYNTNLVKKIRQFSQSFVLSKLDFFANVSTRQVMGIERIGERPVDDFERFQWISTAEKVSATLQAANGVIAKALRTETDPQVRAMLTNIQQNPEHLLNQLKPQLSPEQKQKNEGAHILNYSSPQDSTQLNQQSEEWLELWNSNNPYLSELARDLVRYAFASKGMRYGKQSLAGIIPVAILNSPEVGIGNYYTRLMSDSRNGEHLLTIAGDAYDQFMRSNWFDSELVPKNPKGVEEPSITPFDEHQGDMFIRDRITPEYFLHSSTTPNPDYDGQPNTPRRIISKQQLYRLAGYAEGGAFYDVVDKLGIPGRLVEFNAKEKMPTSEAMQQTWESRSTGLREDRGITQQKVNFLTNTFAKHGIQVETITDNYLIPNAQVANENNKIVVRINPNKVFGDTVIHEFGHVYVDLLGTQNPTVKRGIEQLQGTALYAQVANAYPELSGEALDKEVLVTALGKEGEAIFNEAQLPKWRIWLNRFFRAIGEVLGISPTGARQLAQELLSGKLQRELDGSVSEMPQLQKGDVTDFIDSSVINLTKQLNKFASNEAYSDQLKDLIDHITGVDEALAINNYAAYMKHSLSGLHRRLTILAADDPRTRVTGEETDSLYARQFEFMHQAMLMLQSFQSAGEINPEGSSEDVVEAITGLQSNLPSLNQAMTKLNQIMRGKFRDKLMSTTTNPDLVSGVMDLFDTQSSDYFSAEDETGFQRWMDAMADSNNSFAALVLKDYEVQRELSRVETQEKREGWESLVEKMRADNVSLESFMETDANGNKTGRLVSQFDYPGYEASRRAMERSALDALQGAGKIRSVWYAANTELSPEAQDARKEVIKAHGLDSAEMTAWREKYMKQGSSGQWYPRREYTVPASRWKSKQYEAIQQNAVQAGHLKSVQDLLSEMVSHTQFSIIKEGYLPAVPLDQRSYWEALKASLPKKTDRTESDDVIVDESGRVISFVPFHYLRKLNQQKRIPTPTDASPDEKREIRLQNLAIEEANAKFHAAALDYNLETTMGLFIDTAMNHKFKKSIEGTVLLAREQIAQMKFQRSRGLVDKVASKISGSDSAVTLEGKESNVFKHYEDWLRMVFYEDFEYGDSKAAWIEYSRLAQNVLSFTSIGFNAFSGVSNVVYGETQIAIEAAAGQFFDGKSWKQAGLDYHKDQIGLLYRQGKKTSESKTEAAIKYFDVLQSQDELSGKQGGAAMTKLHKLKMVSNLAYGLQHLGEHQMQNKGLLAILHFEKVQKDGVKMSLFDALEFTDGKLVIPSGIIQNGKPFGVKELAAVKIRVMGVNQYLHGIYNKEDAGAVQKYALGRLAMQFRKWARPGWTKRWGTQMGSSFWNERREMRDEGSYITTAKFAMKLYHDLKKLQVNVGVHWTGLDDTQKANVKRTLIEAVGMISIMATTELLASSLKGFGDDDEDHKILGFIAYESSRLRSEIVTFTPFGILDEGKKLMKSPVPLMGQFEKALHLFKAMVMYPIRDEEERNFQGGQFYGKDKVNTYFTQMVPLYNQLQRWEFLQKNTRYYSLF